MGTSAERKKMIAFLFIALLAGGEAIAVHEKVVLHTGLMLVSQLFHNVAGMRPANSKDDAAVESALLAPLFWHGCDIAIQVKFTSAKEGYGPAEVTVEKSNYVAGATEGRQKVFNVVSVVEQDKGTLYAVTCVRSPIGEYAAVLVVPPGCNGAEDCLKFQSFGTLSNPTYQVPDGATVTLKTGVEVRGTMPTQISQISFEPADSCETATTSTEEAIEKVRAFVQNKEGKMSNLDDALTALQGLDEGLTGFSRGISELTTKDCEKQANLTALRSEMAGIARTQYINYAKATATGDEAQEKAAVAAGNQFDNVIQTINEYGCDAAGCQFDQGKIEKMVEQLLLDPADPEATTTSADQVLTPEQQGEINTLMKAITEDLPHGGPKASTESSSEAVIDAVEKIKPAVAPGAGTGSLLQLDTRPRGVSTEVEAVAWLAVGINIIFFGAAIIIAMTYFPAAFFIIVAFLAAFVYIMMNSQKGGSSRRWRI